MTDGAEPLPIWAVAPGVPSRHILQAALHAAAVLDAGGSPVADARISYWHRATGGVFPEADLQRGERLLVHTGLVEERDGLLVPTDRLTELLSGAAEDAIEIIAVRAIASAQPDWAVQPGEVQPPGAFADLVPDVDRREELLLALGRTFDDARRKLLGAIGEELVVEVAREELSGLGYEELARSVRRLSLTSDQLGYDVSAPRVDGSRRLLEVKATTSIAAEVVVHLSRNEAEVAARYHHDWALVLCRIDADATEDKPSGEVVGWCTHADLGPRLPADGHGGRWEQAAIALPVAALSLGLPRPSI